MRSSAPSSCGLRTRIGPLTGTEKWSYCALVLLVAVAGKFGGSSLAARMSGLSWHEAGALGALMNTRGLVELVILNQAGLKPRTPLPSRMSA